MNEIFVIKQNNRKIIFYHTTNGITLEFVDAIDRIHKHIDVPYGPDCVSVLAIEGWLAR